MIEKNAQTQPSAPSRIRRRAFVWQMVGLVVLGSPWLMGQSTCDVRSPMRRTIKTYGKNAQQLYKTGRKLLKNGNYLDARKVFITIKTKFPFSSYATLADLSIGDTYFKAGKFLRAIDIYKLFTKLHPTHIKSGYAAFQVGECYNKLRPWEFFIVPPPHHRDSTNSRQAIRAFRSFIRRFPTHKRVPEARKKMIASLNLLAKHELHVAKFYHRKRKYRATLWRMEHILRKYPNVPLASEARFRKAKALFELKRFTEAQNAFSEVIQRHPKTHFARMAKSKISEIKRKHPKSKSVPQKTSKKKTTSSGKAALKKK